MKKLVPILMIILGITEIILAVLDVKIPVLLMFVLGAVFIAWGIKILMDSCK